MGGALVYLLKKIRKNPNDYDFGIFGELYSFYNIWSKFHPCKIIGENSAHPVIKAQLFENLDQTIDTDMSFYKHEGDPLNVDNTLKEILANRDFKNCALAMVLNPNADLFEIIGFNGAVESVLNNVISYVHANIFAEDLTRLFRLVKIHIKHPEFTPDPSLVALVKALSLVSIATFKAFIDNGGLPQIGTRLDELFSKYDTYLVLQWFCTLPIITGMTKIFDHQSILDTAQSFKDYLDTVPDNAKKQAYYYFMYTHLCCRGMQNDPDIVSLFQKIEATLEPYHEAPQFRMNLAFIDGSSPNFRMTSENNAYQAFASMVFKTKSYFEPNTHDQSSYPYVPQPPLPKNIYPAAYPAPTQHFTRPAPSLMQRPMTPQGFSSARVSENKNGLFNSSLQKAHSYTNTQARRHPRSSQSVPRPNQSQQPVQIHILQKNKTRA